jgi:hypothetical protein
MSDANVFAAPGAALEREGHAGVRLPTLRYQLLLVVLLLATAVALAELALCVLVGVPALPGQDGRVALALRPGGLDLHTWLTWTARASLGLFVVTATLFLSWLARARRNARALGMPARTPGALLWWFVPVAQLVTPFLAVRGVLQASRGGHGRVPNWFVTWWLVWLATMLWIFVEVGFGWDPATIRYVFSDPVGVVLAIGLAGQGALARPLLLAVVVAIQRAQAGRVPRVVRV